MVALTRDPENDERSNQELAGGKGAGLTIWQRWRAAGNASTDDANMEHRIQSSPSQCPFIVNQSDARDPAFSLYSG